MPENIVINLQADTAGLQKTIDLLEKLGQVDKKTAQEFRKATDDYVSDQKRMQTETQKTVSASENIGKSTAKGVKAAKGEINELKSSIESVGKTIGIAFGISEVLRFGKEAFKAFAEAELNARKLQLTVGINGGLQGDFKKLIDQSAKLQNITIFSDDTIQNVQTAALQFGLTAKQVENLIPILTDFASATGQDLNTALDAVLRGSEGAGRGLQLYGIQVDSSATKGENLSSIIDQMNDKFKGQAAVIANTAAGQIKVIGNAWDDIGEQIGEGVSKLGELLLLSYDKFRYARLLGARQQEKDEIKQGEQNQKIIDRFQKAYEDRSIEALQKIASEKEKFIKKETGKAYSKKDDAIIKAYQLEILAIRSLITEKELIARQNVKEIDLSEKQVKEIKKVTDARREQFEVIQKLKPIDINDVPINQRRDPEGSVRRGAQLGPENIDFEKLEKDTEEHLAIMKSFYEDFAINVGQILSSSIFDGFQTNIDNQIKQIESFKDSANDILNSQLQDNSDRREKDIISEREFRINEKKLLDQKVKNEAEAQKKINEAKRKSDILERAQKLFNIGIATAQNIVQQPGPFGSFIPFWAGLGALQAGAVLSQPLPKYAKGTLSLERGNNRIGVDTIPILANEGEAITPTDIAKDYRPTIEAMHKRAIPAKVLNYMANNYNKSSSNSTAFNYDKLGESLAYYMRDSSNVKIKNVKELAEAMRGEHHNVFIH